MHLGNPVEVAVVGDLASDRALAMLRELRSRYLPNKVVAGGPGRGTDGPPLLRGRDAQGAPSALYVCRDFTCQRPVTEASDVARALGLPEPAPEGFQAL